MVTWNEMINEHADERTGNKQINRLNTLDASQGDWNKKVLTRSK